MALKTRFYEDERVGLSAEDILIGEKYLRKNKTEAMIPEDESLKLYELFLMGHTPSEINKQYPQYSVGQIILTAACRRWGIDRESMQHTLRDRVRAKVVRSVLEQVDFMSYMLSVANAEHIESMMAYVRDPINNPKPLLRIKSIKDYKEVSEQLTKIVQSSTPNSANKNSPLYDALMPTPGQYASVQSIPGPKGPKKVTNKIKNEEDEDVEDEVTFDDDTE